LPCCNTAEGGVVLRLEHVCGLSAWMYRPAARDMWPYVLVSFVFLAQAIEVTEAWILVLRMISYFTKRIHAELRTMCHTG
jgi:hypothetical protein